MKKVLALLLALTMVFALAACGGSSAPAAQAPAAEAPAAEAPAEAGALKVGVFYYTYADTYISSVRTALDAELTALGINFTDYDGNSYRILVQGAATMPAQLAVEPAVVDAGTIAVGDEPRELSFKATNTGKYPLTSRLSDPTDQTRSNPPRAA